MCPTGIVASVPITWEQASEWIAEGTVESLGRLRRSAAQLAAYRSSMNKVRAGGSDRASACFFPGVSSALFALSHPLPYPTKTQVKQEYASVSDYVKASVLGAPMAPNAEGKLAAAAASPAAAAAAAKAAAAKAADPTDPKHRGRLVVWRPNDFPYYFEDGIEHHLLWCAEPLPPDELDRLVRAKFPAGSAEAEAQANGDGAEADAQEATVASGDGERQMLRRPQHLVFVNPAPLQSVLAVWHAHVLVREGPE